MHCYLLVSLFAATPDPIAIVQKALELSRASEAATREYAMTQEIIKRDIGADGKTRSTTAETFEVIPVAGEPAQKLTRRNGHPLSEHEARQAQQKFNAIVHDRERETPEQRNRRLAKYEQKLAQRREMFDEIPAAFTFQMDGEEIIDGHEAWRIIARPRPGYKPKSSRMVIVTRMEGRFWISKQYNRLLKIDAVTTAPVTFGGFLAKVAPGTRITIDQMKLSEEIWVLRRFKMAYDVKIALVKQSRGESEQIMWDFRRPAALHAQ